MNDNPAKGGRGKKAPYESTHYRLPLPLKSLAEEMAANYRELVTEYSNPEDPALIAAVLAAIAPGGSSETKQQTESLLRDYQKMEAEIEQLNQQIEKLKATREQDVILKAAVAFVESKKKTFGKTASQKNKQFSLHTRQWDAFREFMEYCQPKEKLVETLNGWSIGDKCSVRMPSKVVITDCEIVALFEASNSCKIFVPSTDSNFTAYLADLIRP